MSGHITPGPSATGRRHGGPSRSWLIVIISSVLVNGGPIGLPGTGGRGGLPRRCRQCTAWALEQPDGSYVCKNGHRFIPKRSVKGKSGTGKGKRKGKKRK